MQIKEVERLAILEQKVDTITCENKKQSESLDKIADKLDNFMMAMTDTLNSKADKSELDSFKKDINYKIISVLSFLVVSLFAIIGYLIRTLFF